MATQLKPDDFVRTATPTPNIRIAFENGPAVVAINRALADAPTSHATLDELPGRAAISVAPWLNAAPRVEPSADSLAAASASALDGAVVLPEAPAGTSATMTGFVADYRRAFFSTEETACDEVTAAADVMRLYPATTVPDLVAKLIVAIHHAHPDFTQDGLLVVKPIDFECTQAGELMLSTLTDALRLTQGSASHEPASAASVSDIIHAVTPTGNRTFDDAYALYVSLRQAELAFPDTNNDREREAALGEACDRTDAAFRKMLAIPVADHQRAALKVGAAFERYDIAKSGLIEEGEGALLLQAAQILRGTGGAMLPSVPANEASSDPFDTIFADDVRASAGASRTDQARLSDTEAAALHDAHGKLAACPVATADQLLRKMTFLTEHGWYDSGEDIALLLENARQLASIAPAAADRTEWEHNLATHRVLNTAYEANCQIFGRMMDDEPGFAEIERQHDAAMRADVVAEKALLATPAPDITATRIKAELLFDNHYHDDRMQALVDDLRRLEGPAVRSSSDWWEAALAPFVAAKTAERIYDETTYLPALGRYSADKIDIPAEIEQESDRLMNIRFDTEGGVMAAPAPDAAAFAYKFLIAHADGREAIGWSKHLVEEAKRFAPNFPFEAKRA